MDLPPTQLANEAAPTSDRSLAEAAHLMNVSEISAKQAKVRFGGRPRRPVFDLLHHEHQAQCHPNMCWPSNVKAMKMRVAGAAILWTVNLKGFQQWAMKLEDLQREYGSADPNRARRHYR